ncbi:MAG: type pilus assembly protein PilC [Actinomycetota bacterium]|nr:type pilus assembly protein PilC [Actinomycetota bacterium]
MPRFTYDAVAPDGTQVTGEDEASSLAALGIALLEKDLALQGAKEKKSALQSVMQFEITRKKVPTKDLMHFSRQLSAFLKAGVSILDAIEVIQEEMTNKVFRKALDDIVESVRAGSTFSGAARAHPEVFPPVYLGMLESAELTGNLDSVLDQLSDYLERDMEARRKIMSALLYPGIVAGMSVATVGILAGFVLPRFKDFFASLDAKLPLPTRMLLATTDLMTRFWFVFPLLILALAVVGLLSVRTEKGRAIRNRMVLSLPVVGDLVSHSILERFCRVLSSMTQAGVPLPDAMTVTTDGTNNVVWKEKLVIAREAMLRGEGLAGPIAATGLFPATARQMLRVGEETGTLGDQLEGAAVYFERELDYKVARFTGLFEPAVIIFMGLVVGFVAVALVSAMYGIFRSVNLS